MKAVHKIEKRHKCTACKQSFSLKDYLREHLEDNLKCQQKFVDKENVDIRTQCNVCGKLFSKPSCLKAHMSWHSSDVQRKALSQMPDLTSQQIKLPLKETVVNLIKLDYTKYENSSAISHRIKTEFEDLATDHIKTEDTANDETMPENAIADNRTKANPEVRANNMTADEATEKRNETEIATKFVPKDDIKTEMGLSEHAKDKIKTEIVYDGDLDSDIILEYR